MSATAPTLDVIIVGGGIVGATTACALGMQGLRVALLESRPVIEASNSDPYDNRVSAITRASEHIFRALGAWEGMASRRISPFREMQVWDEMGSGAIHFDCADIGADSLGHIIENRVMQTALLARLRNLPQVEIHCPAMPQQLRIDATGAEITLLNGKVLRAALVIGSDGHASWVRAQSGITLHAASYKQSAVVANITSSQAHRDTAWQRFTEEGTVALLPLANGQSSLVWSVPETRASALLELSDQEFLSELNSALFQVAFKRRQGGGPQTVQRVRQGPPTQYPFECDLELGDALGELTAVSARAAYPLQRTHASAYVRPRVALVGDAAHTVHPLAGQGVNLGLLDAAALAEVLADARNIHRDLGDHLVLRRYERWRKGHNYAMQTTIDLLKHLFASTNPAVVWARNVGLRQADRALALKNLTTLHAIGQHGDLPQLAKPAHYNFSAR